MEVTTHSAQLGADLIEPESVASRRDIACQCDDLGMASPDLQAPHQEAPRLEGLQKTATEATQRAKECGVDIAKRGFFSKLLTLVAASAVLVAAALVTGITGGAGIPLLVLACAGFAIAAGDVGCAAYDWYSKAHGGGGLVMGSDSLGNLLHKISSKCGASPETAEKIATYGSTLTRRSLGVTTAAVGLFAAVATPTELHSAVAGITVGRAALDMADGTLTSNSTLLARKKQAHETEAAEAKAQKDAAEPLLQQLDTKEAQLGQAKQTIQALGEELERTTHLLAKYEQLLAEQVKENSMMVTGMKEMNAQLGTLSGELDATTQKSSVQQETIAAQENCIKQLSRQVARLQSIIAQSVSETTPLLSSSETRPRSRSVPLFA